MYFRRAFEAHGKKTLTSLYYYTRTHDYQPAWMLPETYAVLRNYWSTPAYKNKCEKAKKNRASTTGGCAHTSGPKSHRNVAYQMVSLRFNTLKFAYYLLLQFTNVYTEFVAGYAQQRGATRGR